MYPNPGSAGWNPNGPAPHQPPASQPNNPNVVHQQQWQQPPPQPNGQYAPRPANQIPSISQALPQGPPNMATLQPSHPDQYRLPPPPMYGPPPHGYAPQHGLPYPPQPAPRQRTAIACRYCRRRKRFSQECVFTPVSAQTQAFVPAHTVWRNQGAPPQQLYGAYGQPLPQQHAPQHPYPPQQQQQQPQQQQQYAPPGQYQPQPMPYPMPPAGANQPPPAAPQQQTGTPNSTEAAGRKRPTEEPHTPTLPPPNPATTAQLPQHRSSTGEQPHYTYPDPTGLTPAAASPASSTTSYHSAQPAAQPYYATQAPPRRTSPQSSYSYDPSRASSSPHNLATSGTPGNYPPPSATSAPAARPAPGGEPARASTPNGQSQAGRGVRITELVGPSGQQQQTPKQAPSQPQTQAQQTSPQSQQGQSQSQQSQLEQDRGRSAADSDMLNQLNKQRRM
ncbi:hypothetical protein MBLNU459_g2967t2 [Dothideomycetes sp. NU459]